MSWTHLADAHPRAMKRYRCVGCWEFIEIGEQHLCRTGVLDGQMMSARWHPECEEFAFSDGDDVYDGIPGQFSRAMALQSLQSEGTRLGASTEPKAECPKKEQATDPHTSETKDVETSRGGPLK